MKNTILITLILAFVSLPAYAQGEKVKAASKATVPSVSVEEKKTGAVVLDKSKLLELDNLRLSLENATLKAEAAVPAELKARVKEANEAVSKFWQSVGIKPEELNTKWTGAQGPDGSVVLTPVVEAAAATPAPAPVKK